MTFTRRNTAAPAGKGRRTRRGPVSAVQPLENRTLFAITFTDNFDDGVADGWTNYDPIAQAGGPRATYEFVGEPGTNRQFRIATTEPSPNPALGPSRAGTFRSTVYEDFLVSVDLIDWNGGLTQAFGILARTSTPGLGTTDGYALSYSTNGDLDISRVDNEVPDDLDPSVDVFIFPEGDYRLEFEGRGSRLIGRLYDLSNPTIPIAMTTAVDSTYTSGQSGIFTYDNTRGGVGTADTTFDNFAAGTPDPAIAYWRFEERDPGQEFVAPSNPGEADSGLALDEEAGDDPLRTWSEETNPTYRGSVPGATVTATGQPNTTSLEFTPNEDLYTAIAGTLNAHPFNEFTIEASFNTDSVTGIWQNIVGKDGKPTDLAIAPVQLKIRDDTDRLQIEYISVGPDGVADERQVQSIDPIVPGRWYNAAAVMDGTTLQLYLDDTTTPGGYVLQGSVDVLGGMAQSDGTWTVGRGFYNGNIGDWFDGHIDEVRISDQALDPSQFLFAQPDTGGDVEAVYVSGTAWQPAFKQFLAANNLGSADLGYRIPEVTTINDELPWSNINQVSITVDGGQPIERGDLTVNGVKVPQYAIADFTYSAATRTGTWTLQQPLANYPTLRRTADRVTLTFRGDDYTQQLGVVPGDVNRNGAVSAQDYSIDRAAFGRSTGDVGTDPARAYTAFKDVNANGSITTQDLGVIRGNLGGNMGEVTPPAAAALASPSGPALTGTASITQGLFRDSEVLA